MIPNGVIIETIQNENGTAIKFSDGTMICKNNQNLGKLAFDTAYGSVYLPSSTFKWQYPEQFNEDNPTVNLTAFFQGGIGGANLTTEPTTTGCDFWIWHQRQYTFSKDVKIELIAIGRWK